MNKDTRYFNCTACGKCCNRSPELELSETLGLAGEFILRLMFRPYELPISISEYAKQLGRKQLSQAEQNIYLEERKLLEASASIIYKSSYKISGSSIKTNKYIYISAISMDFGNGVCEKLLDNRCSIYEKRPAACKTVPFHFSAVDAALTQNLDRFVANNGFACDISQTATQVLNNGKLVDENIIIERKTARDIMKKDKSWKAAIAAKVQSHTIGERVFPTLAQIDANAKHGATTISILHAWDLAREIRLINVAELNENKALQKELIKAEIGKSIAIGKNTQNLDILSEMIKGY